MEKVVLQATKRDVVGKQVKALRREGKLPAVIYGRHTDPINVNLEAHAAQIALSKFNFVQFGDDRCGRHRASCARA